MSTSRRLDRLETLAALQRAGEDRARLRAKFETLVAGELEAEHARLVAEVPGWASETIAGLTERQRDVFLSLPDGDLVPYLRQVERQSGETD